MVSLETHKSTFLFLVSLAFAASEIWWLTREIPEILQSPDAVVFFSIRMILLAIVLLYLLGQILNYFGWVDFEMVTHDIFFNLPRQLLTVALVLLALIKLFW